MNKFFKSFGELLAITAVIINNIQFVLFSLIGIEYNPEGGGTLVAALNIGFCLYSIAWVIFHEFQKNPIHNVKWPYFVAFLPIIIYFIESILYGISQNDFAYKQLTFFGVFTIPAVFLATYIYRHERFDIVTRNCDIIIIVCTIALIMNIPMLLSDVAFKKIGGGGTHQDISYCAGFCFAMNITNILSNQNANRYAIFQKKWVRSLFFVLLPVQAIICFLGGGRGGSVMLVFAFVSALFLFSRQHFVRTIFISALALAVFVVISSQTGLFSDGFGRAFDFIQGGRIDLTANQSDVDRTMLREEAYRIIGNSPIFGYGLWNGLQVAGYYMHNLFLDICISGGFLYLSLFIMIMYRAYRSAFVLIKNVDNHAQLMAWMIYPSTILLFSGFYLTSGLFWFCVVYALLNKRKSLVYV